ncbi:ribokinase [Sphingobacterium sp.]|uniref:ribokinase n=1 Tax=Sphingobacterium sp. TaxID=341027 RepID=UPI002896A661|nr:ribokinase [Sphingobacterium sp.]
MSSANIVVLGSSNTDMVVKAAHLPAPGETILGGQFFMVPGGKGANQAVAAARSRSSVAFIAKVGTDIFGQQAITHYQQEGIQVGTIFRDEENSSGIALISVDAKGENCILVAPGANATLTPKELQSVKHTIISGKVLLMQLEIPLETIEQAIDIAVQHDTKIILNTAPAQALTDKLFQQVDILVLNTSEAQFYTGMTIENWEEAALAADYLYKKCPGIIIITLGARGSLLKERDNYIQIPAEEVKAVDSTAAGDTFCGVLAACIAKEMPIVDAVKLASKAAAISVTRMGAQTSIPFWQEYSIL